jgi:hypothetical protein
VRGRVALPVTDGRRPGNEWVMGMPLSTGCALLCSVALFACGRSELEATVGAPNSGGGLGGDVDAGANPVVSGAPGEGQFCKPGESEACTGAAGCRGLQSCDSDGTSFGACRCGSPVGDTGVTGDGGAGGAGVDAADNDRGGPGRDLYTRCSTLGALDCSSKDPRIRLLCDGMTWNPIGVCSGQSVCDTGLGPNHGLCTGSDAGIATDAREAPPTEDPGGTGVVLYTRCSSLGAQDCNSQNPKIQVLCDGMTWNPIGVCSGTMICDTRPGPNQGLCK